MKKFNSNSQLKVDGKMTAKGADRVGLLQAVALIIVSVSSLMVAISGLIWVLR